MDHFIEYADAVVPALIDFGLNLLGGLLILILGWVLASWLSHSVEKKSAASKAIDDTLAPVFGQVVRVVVLIVTALAVLAQFGIQTASLLAILGAAGLAIGLALQGTLSNIASGIMLLILRPFKLGDAVEVDGVTGVVDEIGLFTTRMHSFDNIGITIPNSKVWGNKIKNLSQFETRRTDLEFEISYSDDIQHAMKLIRQVIEKDGRVLPDPAPLLAVSRLADNSVVLLVRIWARSSDLWPLRFDLTMQVKEMFDKNEITIPFPQREIHLLKGE